MKKLTVSVLVVALCLGFAGMGFSESDSDTQTVTITFSEIAVLDASGNPGTITIAAPATAGNLPADQTESTTTMSWTANVASGTRKITGNLDGLFPGINLYATVAAPGGGDGTSAGETQFVEAATAYDFVTGITNSNVSGQTITFKASVPAMVAPYTATQQTVTWTLTEAT